MAHCSYCQTETELHAGGVPICARCAHKPEAGAERLPTEGQIRTALHQEILVSTARAHAASNELIALMAEIPSGLPHPDGSLRIQNASRALSSARGEVMKAHSRLNDFLTRRIVPEDLKPGTEE